MLHQSVGSLDAEASIIVSGQKAFEGLGFHDRAISDTQIVNKYQSLSFVKDLN